MRRRVVLPLQEWSELGSRSRREVRRAVRRRQSHSDVCIAQLARAWAVETLRVQSQRLGRRLVDGAVGGTVVAAIWALVPD